MNSSDIAAAVVRRNFPPRRYAVCQNVSWALLPYEADIIAVSEAGTVHEIEIKVTKADLLADAKKQRWIKPCWQVDFYWLAVPQSLQDVAEKRAAEVGGGVLSVYRGKYGLTCDKTKLPVRWINKDDKPALYGGVSGTTAAEHRRYVRNEVWRLAALRYWDIVFFRANNRRLQ